METPFAVCGNGIVEGGEECDDGTRTDGDGCNAKCQVLHRFMLHRQIPGAVCFAIGCLRDSIRTDGDGYDIKCQLAPLPPSCLS